MNYKIFTRIITAVVFLSIFSTGCKKDSFVETPGVCPVILFTNPANQAGGVPLNQVITMWFNEKMDPATLNQNTFSLTSGIKINGALSYNDNNASWTFTPSSLLAPNSTYTAKVTTSVKDMDGNALQTPYIWTFFTGSTIAPLVITTDPANLATSIVLNKLIRAQFSENMNASTFNSTSFTLKQGANAIAGSVYYNGNTAYFDPSANLISGQTYTATIRNTVKSAQGTSLIEDYVWSFSTGSLPAVPRVNLKSVGNFGIIAGQAISNNSGASEIRNMDVGLSPGVRSSITGFPPALIINGSLYASDDALPLGVAAMLTQAKQDLTDAYLFARDASSPAPVTISGDIGGTTLTPGIYHSTSTLSVQSGNLTLNAQGDADAVWIFQIASDFTTVGGSGGDIILSGGAQAKNIFWQVGSSATIGNNTAFQGNILALTSITLNTNAVSTGRVLARNGSVTLTGNNIINKP